ncbi:MAG: YkgJ family cysteine cluster protein [Deltaproteobacteria bacterium]|nr:YkgJ family cysteine cluster protein [Deltaproteobacteria bacterium]
MTTATDAEKEDLCLRCGLCCDGSLFSFLGIKPDEVARVEPRGLKVHARPDGRLALDLSRGCPGLSGKCCTLYGDRPQACRDYKCLLFMALEEGEVGLSEARSVVDETHATLAALHASPSPPSRQDAQRILRRHFLGRHRMD